MKTAEHILADAYKLIQAKGWVQGALCEEDGFCIVGAIVACSEPNEQRYLAIEAAQLACGEKYISQWNDRQGRKVKEVKQVMRKAIRIASTFTSAELVLEHSISAQMFDIKRYSVQ